MNTIIKSENIIQKVKLLFKYIIEFKQNTYLIKICGIHKKEGHDDFFVKYQFANKRLCAEIELNEFLNSPLIHFVHPNQVYYLGIDTNLLLESDIKKLGNHKETFSSRFKRILYQK